MTDDDYIATLERGFEALRKVCDPRGWDLLEELKRATIVEARRRQAVVSAVTQATRDTAKHSLRLVK